MDLETLPNRAISFEQAQSAKNQIIWDKLDEITVEIALMEWFSGLSYRTQINYQSAMKMLVIAGLLNPTVSLQVFSLVNHDNVIDKIKLIQDWKETSRQARAAAYISFTRFLSRKFPHIFKKALPCREGTAKTFYKVHEKVVTEAMNRAQWSAFLIALEQINYRDSLIAKVTLQGGKRISEVLNLQIQQINWERREITFTQSKTKGCHKETVITYPETLMKALKEYVGIREGNVFISKYGNPVILLQVANTFARAGEIAGIPFKVTPHVLRAAAVTYLKQQGFADSEIMKITGHASSEMVHAYDKSSRAENPSKKISLI